MASSVVLSFEYSINFMWINEEKNGEKYIFPELRKKAATQWDINIVAWLSSWLSANPEGTFVFWYNKDTVTPRQIEETIALFHALSKKYLSVGKLYLLPVNDITFVKKNYDTLAKLRKYMRLDLLRLIIALDYLYRCEEKQCAFIYADIDKGWEKIGAGFKSIDLSKDAIFTKKTLEDLYKYGFITQPAENSFFIMSNFNKSNKNMMQAIQTVIVDAGLLRGMRLLKEEEALRAHLPTEELKKAPLSNDFQNVKGFNQIPKPIVEALRDIFYSTVNSVYWDIMYGPLALYFDYLEGKAELKILTKDISDFAEII